MLRCVLRTSKSRHVFGHVSIAAVPCPEHSLEFGHTCHNTVVVPLERIAGVAGKKKTRILYSHLVVKNGSSRYTPC